MLFAGDYVNNCFQTGDTGRFNRDRLSAADKAQLQQVCCAYMYMYILYMSCDGAIELGLCHRNNSRICLDQTRTISFILSCSHIKSPTD